MGTKVSRSLKENGPVAKVRDYLISVSFLWTKEMRRTSAELLRFRVLMIRLEDQHPDIYEVVKNMHRGIDTRELMGYYGEQVKKPNQRGVPEDEVLNQEVATVPPVPPQ